MCVWVNMIVRPGVVIKSLMNIRTTSERVSLVPIFYSIKNQSPAPLFLLFRKKSRLLRLFACKRAHNASAALPTFCGFKSISRFCVGISFATSLHFLNKSIAEK